MQIQVIDCTYGKDQVTLYWRIDNPLPWDAAKAACRSAGWANMVSIHNFDEKKIVEELWSSQAVSTWAWVGLHCDNPSKDGCQASSFKWIDETSFDYTNVWVPNFSPSAKTQCAVFAEYNPKSSDDWHASNRQRGLFTQPCSSACPTICKLIT